MFFRQHLWIGISIILFFALVLSLFGLSGLPNIIQGSSTLAENQETVNGTTTLSSASLTDRPGINQSPQEYTNQDFGFSLSYPDGFEVQRSVYHTIAFLALQGTQGHRVRAFLSVELALDQSAEWFANQAKEENAANLGPKISSSVIVMDGQQAYVLRHIPGQDLNREVFIVYKSILDHLIFLPDGSQAGEGYQQMETLSETIINSLRFLPGRLEVPPVTSMNNMIHQLERAFDVRSEDDIMRPLREAFILGQR